MSIEVLAAGASTTVQDLGRSGHRHLGVGLSGAADSLSLRRANLLLGNAQTAAGLEITLSGPRLRFLDDAMIAICGADIAAEVIAQAGVRELAMRRPQAIKAGEVLRLGACRHVARSYVAVAGGIAVDAVLGSCATDLGAGFGGFAGRALRALDVLPVGPHALDFSTEDRFFIREAARLGSGPCMLRALMGTHGQTCAAELVDATWQVAADADRMGLRLTGARLAVDAGELLSEPVVPGTVQLPPGGAPIVLGVDAPTTGGYPRLAQVIAADLPRLGQLHPGWALRFRFVSGEEARAALVMQERQLALLELALRTKRELRTCRARSI